jgi:hypothetical protein
MRHGLQSLGRLGWGDPRSGAEVVGARLSPCVGGLQVLGGCAERRETYK